MPETNFFSYSTLKFLDIVEIPKQQNPVGHNFYRHFNALHKKEYNLKVSYHPLGVTKLTLLL